MDHVKIPADKNKGALPVTVFPDPGYDFRERMVLLLCFHHDLLNFILLLKGSHFNDTATGYGAISDPVDGLINFIKGKRLGNQLL